MFSVNEQATLVQCCFVASLWIMKYPLIVRVGKARIFKHSMGARNRVRIGLSYRPARLHRLA
jgi:hypothetical protein